MSQNGKDHETPSTEMNPYIECAQRLLKPWAPNHGQLHHSLEFEFDPSCFVHDPSEIIAQPNDQGLRGSVE